jgi:hypothetical protein
MTFDDAMAAYPKGITALPTDGALGLSTSRWRPYGPHRVASVVLPKHPPRKVIIQRASAEIARSASLYGF